MAWAFLHKAATLFEEKRYHKHFKRMVALFTELLPCLHCRNDFRQILKKCPVEASHEWTVRVHNIVNEKLGKKKHH